ncbi:hypothetical protein [Blastococcus brunescens]|uniref:Uncharacterized protein n=1 Tax=Blastococcus brunescens TaxID=1564165 RepID=A0ABZ1B8B6_9ACTN|nr:hypothetical protein [Blastococcus sp. BMG 8361]WRL66366.1 hypothetical protein U6N30_13560 [Blastococcus sp. BMG 8361]
MKRAVVGLLAVALVGAGIWLLRAELMTVEVAQPEGSYTDVVVAASTVREDPAVQEEMTRGMVSTCRLLVNADVAEDSFVQRSEGSSRSGCDRGSTSSTDGSSGVPARPAGPAPAARRPRADDGRPGPGRRRPALR